MNTQVLLAVAALWSATSTAVWAQAAPPPQCDIKTSHFAVTRAVLYIQNASNEQDSVKRNTALESAHRSLVEAIQSGGAVDPSMWYFLGIYYAMKGDGFGTDSAFDKVEAAMPGCKDDVGQYRQIAWARVANLGIEGLRSGDNEKARTNFRLANELFRGDPTASFYLGTVFATEDNADSALFYYKDAAVISRGDTAQVEIHEKSVQNVARIYQVLEQHDSAAVWFREYRKIRSDDPEGLTGHASSLLSAGDTTAAVALYDSILGRAESMDPLDLFRIGVSLFRTNNPERAAAAFEAGLKRNPYYRNGLFNLTNAYFQLAQTAQEKTQPAAVRDNARKMIDAGKRLVAVDPQNGQVIRLLAAGYQLLAKDDSTDLWLKRANDLTWEVEVQVARASGSGYEVQGTITASAPPAVHAIQDSITKDEATLETLKNTTVPAAQRAQAQRRQATLQARIDRLRASLQRLRAPIKVPAITFEFLNAQGNVVATETVAAQDIEPNGVKEFQLTPTGDGIVAWRYKVS